MKSSDRFRTMSLEAAKDVAPKQIRSIRTALTNYVIAPSGMMDGMVRAIRTGLDAAAVAALVQAQPQAQAWTFCPVTLEACGQLNLLLQAEQHLEGFAALAKRFLQALGLQLDPLHFVPQWQNNVPHGFRTTVNVPFRKNL